MSRSSPARGSSLFVFDAARALAALAVLVAHARGFVFDDAAEQPGLGALGRVVFALTALGHQAVVVFLVVSGAMVTRSMLVMQAENRWSVAAFATARVVRLWVVLLPCLVLGGLEDWVGLSLSPTAAYGLPPLSVGATMDHLGGGVLAGNAAFLQAIRVPVFGSNVPLWTLSIEAWCYAYAVGAFSLWRHRAAPLSAALHVVGLALPALFLPMRPFLELAPIWMVGSALAFALSRAGETTDPAPSGDRRRQVAAGVLLGAALLGTRAAAATHQMAGDYLLAVASATVLLTLSTWVPRWRGPAAATRFVAGFSYSLYLSHYPLLALLATAALAQHRLAFSAAGLGLLLAAATVAMIQAVVLWGLFERHTGAVRRFIDRSGASTLRIGVARSEPAR